jgi:iron complex outermembrane receptor protein
VSDEASAGFEVQGKASADHDDNSTKRLYLRSHTEISGASSLDIHASYVDGQSQVPFTSEYEGFPDKTVKDRFISGLWTYRHSDAHEIQVRATHASYSVRQQWVTCFPYVAHLPQLGQLWRQNPTYANTILLGRIPTGGSAQDDALGLSALAAISQLGASALAPWCGQANQDRDETRSDLEIQDTAVVSDRLRVVAGAGLRRERGRSQTFLNGSVANSMYRVFGTAEFKLSSSVSLHAGGYAERDELVGWSTSPRFAINADLSPSQTLRFVVSKGTRSPGIVEQRGDFSYTVQGFAPGPDGSTSARFYQSASSPGNLTSERLVSKEVGYVHLAPKIGASFDVKVFRDELSRLISAPVTVAGFYPSNSGAVTLQGAELQASINWSPGWRAFLNYSYLDSEATVRAERTQYSRHSGSLGVSHERPSGLRLSAAYYATSGDGVHESRFGRTDFALGKRWAASGASVDASFVLSYLDDASISYSFGTGRDAARSAYADRLQAMARIRFVF